MTKSERQDKRRVAVMAWVPESLRDQLDELAQAQDLSLSDIIRRALREHVDSQTATA